MHDPFQLTCEPSKRVSTEDINSLAKRASLMFVEEGTPLNDAIVKLAQENPYITSEQVKRVVEFANQATFQDAFEKQAGDKNIDFEIADPNIVLSRLDNLASPPVVKIANDYLLPPPDVRNTAVEDQALEQIFKKATEETPLEKVASSFDTTPIEYDNHRNLRQVREGLQKTAEILSSSVRQNEWIVKEAEQRFHHELRQHLLDGGDLFEVTEAMAAMCSPKMASAAIKDFEPELRKLAHIEKVDLAKIQAATLVSELTKIASHRAVDPEHPVVESFAAYMQCSEKQAELESSLHGIQTKLAAANEMFGKVQLAR